MDKSDFELNPEEWASLRGLLDTALEREPAQRAAWIDTLDGPLAQFKPRLRELLELAAGGPAASHLPAHVQAHLRMLTLPKVETADFAPAPHQTMPERIGPYRLLRELGSGGMASVWLAERTDMLQGRQVALKLPHGDWGTFGVRSASRRTGLAERMAREREILATLNHPNIASLFDAGVAEDGQPYLALEYVEGERIDDYCKSHKLDVPARLRLFLQAARAVAHAHANLVVHRDLKPSNILVNAHGEVRLLDFGIAKLLDQGVAAETELTQQAGRALTPDYASPEQIRGEAIGTASDVYSLGVVLYELLTSKRPYQLERGSRAALEEAILRAEPQGPSTAVGEKRLQRALRGDLDTIVQKALKKAVVDRYQTVAALADDVQRHLEQRPVLALPDSAWYRARKFVGRNRIAAAAAAAVASTLVVGAVVSSWQARRAIAEQQRAEQVAGFIATVFKEANPYQQGSGKPLTGAELLRLAKDRLLAAPPSEAQTRVELLTLLGSSLLSLEDLQTAGAVLQQAVKDATATLGPEHPRTLRAQLHSADVLRLQDKNIEAGRVLDAILPPLRRHRAEHPSDLAQALRSRADVEFRQGRMEASAPYFKEGLDVAREHLGDKHPDHLALLTLQARSLRTQSKPAEALQASQSALNIAQALHAAAPRHPVLSEARYTHAYILADNGRYREAVQVFRTALAETEALFGRASRRFAVRLGGSSEIFAMSGLLREGIANAELARATLLTIVTPRSRLDGVSAEGVALANNWARDGEQALPHWRHAESVFVELMGEPSWVVQITRRNLSLALTWTGSLDEAERVMAGVLARSPLIERDGYDVNAWLVGIRERLAGRPAVAMVQLQRALDSIPASNNDPLARARILAERGLTELAMDRQAPARASLTEALLLFDTRDTDLVPEHADALLGLGRAELAAGQPALALPRLQRAEAFWRDLRPDSRWAGEAAYWLGRCHAALGQNTEARAASARAARILATSPFSGDRELVAGRLQK